MRSKTWISNLILALALSGATAMTYAGDDEEAEKTVIGYAKLSPSIVANLADKSYIRCEVQLMTRDDTQLEEIELHSPALRHEILLTLSDQPAAEVKGTKGKEKMRKAALKAIQATLKEETGKELVDDLFFTTYLVQ